MNSKRGSIITIIVAALAFFAVIFMVITLGFGIGNPSYDDKLSDEMYDTAKRLVRDNYTVLRLFNAIEFDKDAHFEIEPYGNPTEDGYYTLKSGVVEFDTVDEIFELVDNTFVEDVAYTIKNDESLTGGTGPIYKDRDGRIGINANFRSTQNELITDAAVISLTFVSDEIITITLSPPLYRSFFWERETNMIKGTDGVWRLENII